MIILKNISSTDYSGNLVASFPKEKRKKKENTQKSRAIKLRYIFQYLDT